MVLALFGGRQAVASIIAEIFATKRGLNVSVDVRVKGTKGGEKIAAFIARANNPELVASLAAEEYRRRILGELRSKLPKLTGRAANSLRIEQRGASVALLGIWYAPFIVDKRTNQSIYQIVASVVRGHREAVAREVVRQLAGV